MENSLIDRQVKINDEVDPILDAVRRERGGHIEEDWEVLGFGAGADSLSSRPLGLSPHESASVGADGLRGVSGGESAARAVRALVAMLAVFHKNPRLLALHSAATLIAIW